MSSHKSKRKQKGGDLSQVNTWGQTSAPPSSYKIQVGYVEVPKTLQLDPKWLDTPYRFKSFQDANGEAGRLFDGYQYRIIGSNDRPHWDAPSYLHQNVTDLGQQQWYNVVGVDTAKDSPYSRYAHDGGPPQLTYDQYYSLEELERLKTQSQTKQLAQLAEERSKTDSREMRT